MIGSYQASCWLRCSSMRLLALIYSYQSIFIFKNIWAVQCSCRCYFPWYLPFLPGLLLPCHSSPVLGGGWHGFPSTPECFRTSGPLLHSILPTLSWITLPWLQFKCRTVIDNAHPTTSFGYTVRMASKGRFP